MLKRVNVLEKLYLLCFSNHIRNIYVDQLDLSNRFLEQSVSGNANETAKIVY